MSRGSSPRHVQTAGDLGFAVQFNAENLNCTAKPKSPAVWACLGVDIEIMVF